MKYTNDNRNNQTNLLMFEKKICFELKDDYFLQNKTFA